MEKLCQGHAADLQSQLIDVSADSKSAQPGTVLHKGAAQDGVEDGPGNGARCMGWLHPSS